MIIACPHCHAPMLTAEPWTCPACDRVIDADFAIQNDSSPRRKSSRQKRGWDDQDELDLNELRREMSERRQEILEEATSFVRPTGYCMLASLLFSEPAILLNGYIANGDDLNFDLANPAKLQLTLWAALIVGLEFFVLLGARSCLKYRSRSTIVIAMVCHIVLGLMFIGGMAFGSVMMFENPAILHVVQLMLNGLATALHCASVIMIRRAEKCPAVADAFFIVHEERAAEMNVTPFDSQ
jgi:hypothetical protein